MTASSPARPMPRTSSRSSLHRPAQADRRQRRRPEQGRRVRPDRHGARRAASRCARASGSCSQVGPDHFTGSLSDAIGPVDIVVDGDTATIRYMMKGGHLKIVQQIQLQPDGKTLSNHVIAQEVRPDIRARRRDDPQARLADRCYEQLAGTAAARRRGCPTLPQSEARCGSIP